MSASLKLTSDCNVTHAEWRGDEDEAILIDVKRGQLLGWYRHDGFGKWDHQVYVSFWRAFKILITEPAGIASWSPFPRCAVWIFRSKSADEARHTVEGYGMNVVDAQRPLLTVSRFD